MTYTPNDTEIITLPPSAWKEYRDIRLEALRQAPEAYSSTYKENAEKPDVYWEERLKDAAEQKNQWLYFARANNSIVGMAGAFTLKDIIHVIAVYVQEKHRGKGIAYAVMNELLAAISTARPEARIEVEVNAQQVPAHRLYQKLGFTEVSREERVLGDGKKYEVITLAK